MKTATNLNIDICRALARGLVALCALGCMGIDAQPRALGAPKIATGSGVIVLPHATGPIFDITRYGAAPGASAVVNQSAINAAIEAAAKAGGGTVVIPAGRFKTYSIRLKSHVGLHFASSDAVIAAAVEGTGPGQDGGFYDAPEPNPFVGLQDGGHSHWANSLIYGINVSNVLISGPGLIDGSYVDKNGILVNVLSGGDPRDGASRNLPGVAAGANKAIALKNATNIVFRDFRIKNGGHFAILGTAVSKWTIDGIIVDTNRDAIDIDTCQNVSIRNSVFNSLTDDAVVLKGSFGIGRYLTSKNILIEKVTVSGYDAGSVLDKTYSTAKLVASDRDGPTGRVKFGTEGTSGLDTVTVRNVLFDRSRGFALESVDGAELKDILFTNVHMKHVSSSPIFILIGDRGRAPVTGNSEHEEVMPSDSVRLSETTWVLPNVPSRYGSYPARRYVPAYDKTYQVPVGGADRPFSIVNPSAPVKLNAYSINPKDAAFANAVGVGFARIRNITIRNVVVEDADPRYPMLLNGLVGHPIENVRISNVSVEYRGGLKMEHAVQQRQLNQTYSYKVHGGGSATQSIPWMVNTFFSKNEALLPRIAWNPALKGGQGDWEDDPYNVPEMTREYPEPSIFGILPAYGLYARHVQGLFIENVKVKYDVVDERPAVVLDDVDTAKLSRFSATSADTVPTLVRVKNTKKRDADFEYVKDRSYSTTTTSGLVMAAGVRAADVTVDRPAPGTPPDSLYPYPTAPSKEHPYSYAVPDSSYPRPLTVYRPAFEPVSAHTAHSGDNVEFDVEAKTPAPGQTLRYGARGLPAGATFDPATRRFSWTPSVAQIGSYQVTFVVDDGVLPVTMPVSIRVLRSAKR